MEDQAQIWPKHITVDKRIVKILSGSTYANFPSAIREIVINSYDADAENVWIELDLKKEIITIRDDGRGMNEEDFAFYLRIAGKSRKKDLQITKAKRAIVGQFGVGFLSALPFCQKYIIETKRKNTDQVVHATISSTEYFRDDFSNIDVEEIPINGSTKSEPNSYSNQYTRIRLVGFSKLTKAFFNSAYAVGNRRNTVNNYLPFDLFKWQLAEYLPIVYESKTSLGKQLNELFKSAATIFFKVFLNGKQIYRNIHAKEILEISEQEKKIGEIKFKYAILTNYEPINPSEARYLMLRNLNVGVGERTTFDLGLDGKIYGKLAHLTGEVNIIEGLNDLISVSRDKFNFSPDYEKLKEFLRQRLSKWANELDNIKTLEKVVSDFNNESSVSSLNSLKKDKVKQDIQTLKDKGFNFKKTDDKSPGQLSRLDKNYKEIIVTKDPSNYNKVITVLDKKYNLNLEKWSINNSDFPAIKINGNNISVNESYPLFKNSVQFDTFLKFHILLHENLTKKQINKSAYTQLNFDLLKIFNK